MIEFFFAAMCANVVVPEATDQAMRYYQSGNLIWILEQLLQLGIPLLFLFTGFSGKLGAFAKKWGENWYFSIVLYLALFISLYQLLSFPLDFYSGYIREHDYYLSMQPLGRWFGNYGKGLAIAIVAAAAFLWIFYLLLKKSPRRWWFYSSLVTVALLFISMLIQPIWIDPLFNQFGRMKNKELEEKILALASRAEIENGRVFEVDKSKDTQKLNAYVVGLGPVTRIVLWDTTIKELDSDQILFVMGHEMGHYVLNHIWWSLIYLSALSFLMFYLVYRSANFLLRRYHKQFGFKHLYDIASLPLLLFLMAFFMLFATPLINCISRTMEHEADRFGLEITQNNQIAGETFVILQRENLANPRPGIIYKIWRCSHPPIAERVDFCNSYCPWKEGKPLKYEKYFR
ncbi:MAG TPA: M48 family metallopeptidase [Rhabdochlamydiaceae bacterium]|nr:M48 family metallopeptidase [Rhabdochlamydiaceae bacterium]